jgi:hypothetical protein
MDTTIISATRGPDTYVVPSLALAEVAALSPEEREKLLTELRAAEALVEARKCVVYHREDQRRRFENIYSRRS